MPKQLIYLSIPCLTGSTVRICTPTFASPRSCSLPTLLGPSRTSCLCFFRLPRTHHRGIRIADVLYGLEFFQRELLWWIADGWRASPSTKDAMFSTAAMDLCTHLLVAVNSLISIVRRHSAVMFGGQYRKRIEAKDSIARLDIQTSVARATCAFEQRSLRTGLGARMAMSSCARMLFAGTLEPHVSCSNAITAR